MENKYTKEEILSLLAGEKGTIRSKLARQKLIEELEILKPKKEKHFSVSHLNEINTDIIYKELDYKLKHNLPLKPNTT